MYDVRSTYLADSVATAGPARLLTMLYDRLLLDLDRAGTALHDGHRQIGAQHLVHAQAIVAELMSSLDVGAWDGGPRLLSIYTYLHGMLSEAAATGDSAKAQECRDLVAPLAEAWHGAADQLARSTATARTATFAQGADEVGSSVLGVA